jgi:hypothetical protein
MYELLNAFSMLPGYGLTYFYFSCLPYQSISVLLYSTVSFVYHCAIHYQSSYKNLLFKLDILSQQFSCYCLTTSNPLSYFILGCMTFTSLNELQAIRPYIISLNAFLFIGVSYPNLFLIQLWFFSFICFFINKYYKLHWNHAIFHLISHLPIYYYLGDQCSNKINGIVSQFG